MGLIVNRSFTFVFFISFSFMLVAQVTVGSTDQPKAGAILDIREFSDAEADSGGRNANRGLVLPRVELNSINSLANVGVASNAENKSKHIGLVIYNTNRCLDYSLTDTRGLYVWTGEQWERLGEPARSPEVFIFVDDRNPDKPEKYFYRKFGNAGVWMLENIRATTYAQGGTPPTIGLMTSAGAPYDVKKYAYPGRGGDGTDPQYFNQLPAMGLLYTWAAATNNENLPDASHLNQGQKVAGSTTPGADEVESVMPNGVVQGICPNGWHVPSDREWNQLEKEIATFPEKYSTNSGTSWNPNWEIAESDRGEFGETLKTSCIPPPGFASTAVGKSLSASEGGFNLYMNGFANASSGSLVNYGQFAYYRTSSSSVDVMNNTVSVRAAYHRSLGSSTKSVLRIFSFRNNMMNVRCKKDTDATP